MIRHDIVGVRKEKVILIAPDNLSCSFGLADGTGDVINGKRV